MTSFHEDRKWALRWWRSLSIQEKDGFAQKHFPDMSPIAVSASSSGVTQIWKREIKGKK